MVRGDNVWLRGNGCPDVAVIRSEVLAQLVGCDGKLVELGGRLRCGMCGIRGRVRVRDDATGRSVRTGSIHSPGKIDS
jgi:hypothetical protein